MSNRKDKNMKIINKNYKIFDLLSFYNIFKIIIN